MKHTTHRLIITGLTALSLATISLTPAMSEARRSDYRETCARDARGRIARSPSVTREFKEQTGYPGGRPGYRIDHSKPLAWGGADHPSNLQWLSKEDKRAKDRVEWKGCR
jgi:hypothetical protein